MKNFALNFCLFVASTVVGLLLCEILVRIISPQQLVIPPKGAYRPDSLLGYRHTENINMLVDTGERITHLITDNYGYRINRRLSGRNNPADISILFIGDSYIEALSVENEQAIPEILATLLSNKYGIKVLAVNDGVASWDPNHYYLEARQALNLRKYDLGIVFLCVANDCITKIDTSLAPKIKNVRYNLRIPRRFSREELVSSILYPINNYLERKSHLFIFLKNRSEFFLMRLGLKQVFFPDVFQIRERTSPRWEVVARECSLIKGEFDQYHTPLLFVLIPEICQVYEKIFREYIRGFKICPDSVDLEQPNRMLTASFRRHSLELLDPLYYMRQKAAEGMELYGAIDRHLSVQGHLLISEYILPYVEKQLARKLKKRPRDVHMHGHV